MPFRIEVTVSIKKHNIVFSRPIIKLVPSSY